MLNSFCASWNKLYKGHPSNYFKGSVTILEKEKTAKNKTITINCSEVVSIPSKDFSGYDLFSALSNSNCDSALLIQNDEGTYDLVFIEMKSRFDTEDVFKAKGQIVKSYAKLQSLLQMMKAYPILPIKRVFGVIETKTLDENQEDYWFKLQQLPDKDLDFGWLLIKYGKVEGQLLLNSELNMPEKMTFRLLLSDAVHLTVNYSDICI